ncbi:hypothetical protein V8E53_007489 [Lactarius tabidus]
MNKCFPLLEHLSLWSVADTITTLTLPKAFLAPNLRHLALPSTSPPRRLRVLSSTASLVTLMLWNIQPSNYIRPRLLVARISSLSQLQDLSIGFAVPVPRPSSERELLGPQGATVTLPNLKTLAFYGVSAYLESLVSQIRVPLLERLDITLFNQLAFTIPHLSRLINTTKGFKLPTANVDFDRNEVTICAAHHKTLSQVLLLRVICKQLDWQIGSAAQICGPLIHVLSAVEDLRLNYYTVHMPTEFQKGQIDATTWHDLLRVFTGVVVIEISYGLLWELSRALKVGGVGSDLDFLPGLDMIFSEKISNVFTSFKCARKVEGRRTMHYDISLVSRPLDYLRQKRPPLLEDHPTRRH